MDLTDERWAVIEPLIPKLPRRSDNPGRPWKIERLFAWLQNFRRIAARYEHRFTKSLGFVQPGCILILLRQYS